MYAVMSGKEWLLPLSFTIFDSRPSERPVSSLPLRGVGDVFYCWLYLYFKMKIDAYNYCHGHLGTSPLKTWVVCLCLLVMTTQRVCDILRFVIYLLLFG